MRAEGKRDLWGEDECRVLLLCLPYACSFLQLLTASFIFRSLTPSFSTLHISHFTLQIPSCQEDDYVQNKFKFKFKFKCQYFIPILPIAKIHALLKFAVNNSDRAKIDRPILY
jgi:hypothetical protein